MKYYLDQQDDLRLIIKSDSGNRYVLPEGTRKSKVLDLIDRLNNNGHTIAYSISSGDILVRWHDSLLKNQFIWEI